MTINAFESPSHLPQASHGQFSRPVAKMKMLILSRRMQQQKLLRCCIFATLCSRENDTQKNDKFYWRKMFDLNLILIRRTGISAEHLHCIVQRDSSLKWRPFDWLLDKTTRYSLSWSLHLFSSTSLTNLRSIGDRNRGGGWVGFSLPQLLKTSPNSRFFLWKSSRKRSIAPLQKLDHTIWALQAAIHSAASYSIQLDVLPKYESSECGSTRQQSVSFVHSWREMFEIGRAVTRRQTHSSRRNNCSLEVGSDWQWRWRWALSLNYAV